jgi:hypothetical protein
MNTAAWMLDHVTHRDPYPTITAPPALRMYTARADENREAYFAQSAATRNGVVPTCRIGTYHSKRGPVKDCPQADQF